MAVYLDTSAAVKLIARERESAALRGWLSGRTLASSAILRIELFRAMARVGQPGLLDRCRALLRGLALVHLNNPILDRAATLAPPSLRSLHAVHVATAIELGSDLAGLVTYDHRMIDAANSLGLPVVSPH